jgi:hypothetical protein
MKSEKQMCDILECFRTNGVFYDSGMTTEYGASEDLCRVLEWVLHQNHDYQGYTEPSHKVPKLIDMQWSDLINIVE